MKKLFVKEDKMVNGELVIRKETLEQVVEDLVYINTMLGNDIFETEQLACRIWNNSSAAVRVPVTTTEKIWKKLKESGKKVKLVAVTEKAEKPTTMEIALI